MAVKKPYIGELRLVGHFENNTGKVAYTAGYIDGYTNIITSVRCKLTGKKSFRKDEFGEIVQENLFEMICRFQSAIDQSIKVNTKFVQGNRRFTIIGFDIIDERTFYYSFTLAQT